MILDALYAIAGLAYLPVLLWRMFAQGKYRSGWGQRFGAVPPRNSARRCVWIHAVSLGEVNATRTLVAELQRRLPDHDIVMSTTTQTGYDAASREYRGRIAGVIRYPLDFSWSVRRVFDRVRPGIILLMELEVWPNLLAHATRRQVPVCIVNGRVTEERSMRRFRMPGIRQAARWMFSRLTWVAAQDDAYAQRFRELGVAGERVHVVGTLKFDTAHVAERIPGDAPLASAMGIRADWPVLVAGSTGPGEEEIVLDAWMRIRQTHPRLQLVIVPRKPERFDEVARLIESRGLKCVRRSRRPDSPPARQDSAAPNTTVPRPAIPAADRPAQPDSPHAVGEECPPTVLLGDTMGELRKFYSLSSIVFVGRSLVPMGGSDVMEVAGLAKPILMGPHRDNFLEATAMLQEAGALANVTDAASFAAAAQRWLDDAPAAHAAGMAGRAVVLANTGATRRTVDLVLQTIAGDA